jgi:hypothetical protein
LNVRHPRDYLSIWGFAGGTGTALIYAHMLHCTIPGLLRRTKMVG